MPVKAGTKRKRLTHVVEEDDPVSKKRKQEESEEEEDVAIDEQSSGDTASDMSEEEPATPSSQPRTGERGGTIREVLLENFMCHRHLKTVLHPQINFLTGPNGSGKSAVLVAIAIGLGAKSSFTNRGKRIDSVITKGHNYTKIIITLFNGDRSPFKYDQYGETITVERYIKRGGGGSYKLKNHRGKTVNSTRAELVLLTEHYNIQVNNPCAILMQDTSRQYLAESTPKLKYNFYLKATQLEKILADYDMIKGQIEVMENLLRKRKDTLGVMKKSVNQLKAEYNDLKKLRTLETDISKLKDKLAWALIQEKEKNKDELAKAEQKLIAEKQKSAANISKIQTSKDQANQLLEDYTSSSAQYKEKLRKISEERSELDAQLTSKTREFRGMKSEIKDIETRKRNLENRLHTLEQKIEQVKEEALQDSAQEEQQILDKIDSLKHNHATFEKQCQEYQNRIKDKLEVKKQIESECDQHERQVRDKRMELRTIQKRIADLKNQQTNRAAAYGSQIPALLDLIEKNIRRFRKRPIGPIGLDLKLQDPAWGVAVEAAIGKIFGSFIVDNHDVDEKILRQLANEVGFGRITMIVQKHEPAAYQIPREHLPPSDVLTIPQVLQWSSPMLFNTLVDQTAFHRMALIKNRQEGDYLIADSRSRVGEAYLPDGSKMFTKGGAANFVSNRRPLNRLGQDTAKAIKEEEDRFVNAQEDLKNMERYWSDKNNEKLQVERELKQLQAHATKITRQMREIDSEVTDLNSDLRARARNPSEVIEMEENAKALKLKIEDAIQQLKDKPDPQSLKGEIQSVSAALEAKAGELDELSKQMEEVAAQIRHVQDRIFKCDSLHTRYSEKLLVVERAIKDCQTQQNQLQEELDGDIEKLQKNGICSREEVGEITLSPVQIDKQITIMETRLNTQLSAQGRKSIDDSMREYADAQNKYRSVTQQYQQLEQFCEGVSKELDTRFSDWKKLRRLTAKQIRSRFTGFLSQKGYAGTIQFDHKAKTLDITVQLEKFREGSRSHKQTVNSLSGGERSFSTVSLLMALWATMETPFTAMDEFDVFMDQISRMKSTEMLLSFARGCSNRQQFIFITPQSLQNIEAAPDLHIINMFPPR